jgi:hypothetical protein
MAIEAVEKRVNILWTPSKYGAAVSAVINGDPLYYQSMYVYVITVK